MAVMEFGWRAFPEDASPFDDEGVFVGVCTTIWIEQEDAIFIGDGCRQFDCQLPEVEPVAIHLQIGIIVKEAQ